MEYNFTIQFLAEGTGSSGVKPAEAMLKCSFSAPSVDKADEYAESVSKLYSDMQLVQQAYRPYELVKSWK